MGTGELAAIAALGNPGVEYQMTRHNAGFWVADALADQTGVRFRLERKLNGEIARVTVASQSVPILKPMTFMNESGRAVAAFCAYHKLGLERLLVIHDDLDLPLGAVRLKRGGGHGGHNGLRDIMAHIGADFMRMRIGIGRPPPGMDAIRYVLSRAGVEEEAKLLEAVETALRTLPLIIDKGLEAAMQFLHSNPVQAEPGSVLHPPASRPGTRR